MRWLGVFVVLFSYAVNAEEKFVKCEFAEGVELNIVFSLTESPQVTGHFKEGEATTVINSGVRVSKIDNLDTFNWVMDVFYENEIVGKSEKWNQFRGNYDYEKSIFTLKEYPDDPQETPFTMLPCHVKVVET